MGVEEQIFRQEITLNILKGEIMQRSEGNRDFEPRFNWKQNKIEGSLDVVSHFRVARVWLECGWAEFLVLEKSHRCTRTKMVLSYLYSVLHDGRWQPVLHDRLSFAQALPRSEMVIRHASDNGSAGDLCHLSA